jgi:hypothetical protein
MSRSGLRGLRGNGGGKEMSSKSANPVTQN